uniref:Uncharacterized protein n=1 Tax=Triticum urartu TaxID=4572 RepID=A0A8R7UQN9_TRIUA
MPAWGEPCKNRLVEADVIASVCLPHLPVIMPPASQESCLPFWQSPDQVMETTHSLEHEKQVGSFLCGGIHACV